MIILNVTTKVDHSIAKEWVQWMLNEYAPEMIATLCFTDFTLAKLVDADDEEGVTYAIQYRANSMADYDKYNREFDRQLRKKAADKWGTQIIAFRTIMEVIQ